MYIEQDKKMQLDYLEENGEKKLYINQSFTQNESGAIIYDIKTSLLGANDIIITKNSDTLKIEVQLYNIKDIYKTILDEMQAKYEEQKKNAQSNENNIATVTQEDINEIQKIYKKYELTNENLIKIGLTIEIQEKSENNKEITLYTNICNSKIGVKLNIEKTYTEDVGEIPTIDEKNTVILNKYSKEQIEGVVKIMWTKIINTIKQTIQ